MSLPAIPGIIFNCSAKHGYIGVKPEGEVRPCCRWKDLSPPLDMFETFEDILDYIQYERWYPSKCGEMVDWMPSCGKCNIREKCVCFQCPVMPIECERCILE